MKKAGVAAQLDNLFAPHAVIQKLQQLGNVSNEKAYLYWNMGNGMLVVLSASSANVALEEMQKAGYEAQIAGKIVEGNFVHLRAEGVDLNVEY